MSEAMIRDLAKSGLEPVDLDARALETPERNVVGVSASLQGYVLPYFKMDGTRLPFYRVRLFDHQPKYKQPKNTPNHLYFPPNFHHLLKLTLANKDVKQRVVILTEGEKKAAAAAKLGYPAVAVSGVDSWKNRTIKLPDNVELIPGQKDSSVVVKMKDSTAMQELADSEYAKGFEELIQILSDKRMALTLVIIYDTDEIGVKYEVQRAAAVLGYELRHFGISTDRIRQAFLYNRPDTSAAVNAQTQVIQEIKAYNADPDDPDDPRNETDNLVKKRKESLKTGLDDFIVREGAEAFHKLIHATMHARTAFPRHPNVKDYVNKKLQSNKLARKDSQKVAISILTELDAKGIRLRNRDTGTMFYFDEATKKLNKIQINSFERDLVDIGEFGNKMFEEYGLGRQDRSVMGWLAQYLSTEVPIIDVVPRRIVYADRVRPEVYYQINDGQYIKITSDYDEPAKIVDNGTGSVLFESDMVQPIDPADLTHEIEIQKTDWLSTARDQINTDETRATKSPRTRVPPNWWFDVLKSTRLRDIDNVQHVRAIALLFYISPWLNRWRGTQLPVELLIGESGSGKSTLMSLRLETIIGSPHLRNSPSDLKDYYSSIVNSGALHVTDNVKLDDKQLRQKLSDEICRLVTEPDPHIELRKLYTTADLARYPVDCVFAFTAITQPFPNADLIARAFLIELDKQAAFQTPEGGADGRDNAGSGGQDYIEYGSGWLESQICRDGRYSNKEYARAAWIAHHSHFLSALFRLIEVKWNKSFSAKHRLINFEQLLTLAAEVFGWDEGGSYGWVSKYLSNVARKVVSESDWTLEGINAWVEMQRAVWPKPEMLEKQRWTTGDMVAWFEGHDEYKDCNQLINARRLGRYLQQHRYLVNESCRLIEAGKRHGSTVYRIGA